MEPFTPPVVEDDAQPAEPGGGEMDAAPGAPEASTEAGEVMSEPVPEPGGGEGTGDNGGGMMAPVPSDAPSESTAVPPDTMAQGDAYLRLVLRLEDGELSVVDGSVVDGPLVEPDLTGQMLYQALVGERRVAAGALADLEHQFGLAPPDDDEGVGHSMGPLASADFVVRIPREEITSYDLADLDIQVLRPQRTVSASDADAGQDLTEAAMDAGDLAPDMVAELHGVDLADAVGNDAEEIERFLR